MRRGFAMPPAQGSFVPFPSPPALGFGEGFLPYPSFSFPRYLPLLPSSAPPLPRRTPSLPPAPLAPSLLSPLTQPPPLAQPAPAPASRRPRPAHARCKLLTLQLCDPSGNNTGLTAQGLILLRCCRNLRAKTLSVPLPRSPPSPTSTKDL